MIGILLIQLGTPASTSVGDVRRYLREFLMDPRVINIPTPLRWMLVNLIIAPFRSSKSAHAYRAIWTDRGSPLRFHTEDLVKGVQEKLGSNFVVRYCMRYGEPSIEESLKELLKLPLQKLLILPLYPQFAGATTQSCWDEVARVVQSASWIPETSMLGAFYNDPNYLSALHASVDAEALKSFDHILFSYHGLPESQIKETDCSAYCLSRSDCCDRPNPSHLRCYRAQCLKTTDLLRERLALPASKVTSSFQSRLGRSRWIGPYTEEVLKDLAQTKKVKRLAVICPSFVSDCLETLEEIGIRGRETFQAAGGEDLVLLPALNASEPWIKGLSELLVKNAR